MLFLKTDIETQSDLMNILPLKNEKPQILYLSESSNFSIHQNDTDTRKISEMLSSYRPDLKIHTAEKGALHAGIYKILLQQIPKNSSIETVVLTLNLRSFGADWIYSKLETSLQKKAILLKPGFPLINRILLSFKGYDIKTDKERERQVIQHWKNDRLNYNFEYKNTREWDIGLNQKGILNTDGTISHEKTVLACHYVKSYAFDISNGSNVRIDDFDEIVEICSKRKWNLVMVLLAEDMEKANLLVGNDLIFLMNRNKEFLIKRYQSNPKVIVVDNLDNVPSKHFLDQNWTTEHYDQTGRSIIAKNIADSISILHPVTH